MIGTKRVNLSLTVRMHRAVSAYAEMVGRTRTAVIVEAMGYQLGIWEHNVRSKRFQEQREVERERRVEVLPVASVAVLNQRALWNAERERKQAAKAARRAKRG